MLSSKYEVGLLMFQKVRPTAIYRKITENYNNVMNNVSVPTEESLSLPSVVTVRLKGRNEVKIQENR